MLEDLNQQLEKEQEETGRRPIWKDMYELMRCRKQSCDSAPHCLIDEDGKHIPMNGKHVTTLIEYATKHGPLKSHDEIPRDLRAKLIAEHRERKGKQASKPGSARPPIHITNLLPGHSQSTSGQGYVSSEHPPGATALQPLVSRSS